MHSVEGFLNFEIIKHKTLNLLGNNQRIDNNIDFNNWDSSRIIPFDRTV